MFSRTFIVGTLAIYAVEEILANWEAVKGRILAVWAELKRAAPVWAGGEGEGWRALASTNTGIAAVPRDLEGYIQSWAQSVQDLLMSTETGRALFANGWLRTVEASQQAAIVRRLSSDAALMGIPEARTQVAIGPVTNNIVINTQPGADPAAIGEAARSGVGDALRNVMGDIPAMP
jgi:hypothetical protein